MDLKPIPKSAIPAAIERAKHYRLLNEPAAAESICLDVLRVDPDNQEALVVLILAISDNSGGCYRIADQPVEDLLARLEGEYERAYYAGLVEERRGLAKIRSQIPGSSYVAHDCLTAAMAHYERAMKLADDSSGDPTLRWNTCARLIERNHLQPRSLEHIAELGD